jgi:hypothetical protein
MVNGIPVVPPEGMVYVFSFRGYSPQTGEMVNSPRKATPETIERIHGEMLKGTGDLVSMDDLDGNGFVKKEGLGDSKRSKQRWI